MSLYLRSLFFMVCFYGGSFLLLFGSLPLLMGSRQRSLWLAETWSRMVTFFLEKCAHITYEVRGWEHLPSTPCIIAAKHQSAWDTLIYHQIVKDPALVMKAELMWIPLYSWYIRKLSMIVVDRKAGRKALIHLVRGTKEALASHRPVIIFPEGTRTSPGERVPYQSGVTALYDLGVPVVPAATNSGIFWGKRSFLKPAGKIILEFLPPLPPHLSRSEMLAALEETIETASQALNKDASFDIPTSPFSKEFV